MFNDDAAAILQKYIFKKKSTQYSFTDDYYDDRLYNQRPSQNSQQRNRPPQQRPANQHRGQTFYDANGNPIRQNRHGNGQNQQYRQNGVQNQQYRQNGAPNQQYRQPNGQNYRNQQNQYAGDETRYYTIEGRNNRR